MVRCILLILAGFLTLQVLVIGWCANGPFSDEGIYALAGMSTLAGHEDTTSYALWLDGTPYIFPLLSGAGYLLAGLAGSRIIALLFYIAGLLLFARSVRRCLGQSASFWALLLLGINGVFFSLAHLAVYDAAAFLGLAGCMWCAVELTRSPEPRWVAWGALCAAFALVSRYSALIILLPCSLLALVAAHRGRWQQAVGTALGAAAIAAAYMVLAHGCLIPPLALDSLMQHQRAFSRLQIAFVVGYIMVLPLGLGAVGLWRVARTRAAFGWVLFGASLLWPTLHIAACEHVSLHKDTTLSLVYLYPLAGVAFARLWQTRRATAVLLLCGTVTWGGTQWYFEERSWSDIRPLAQFLLPKLDQGDTVAIATGWDFNLYAVTERSLPPGSVVDRWRYEHGEKLCDHTWIVGLRARPAPGNDGELSEPRADTFAREAERCGFTPVANLPASYYFVWPPLVRRSPAEFVVYRRSGSGRMVGNAQP
jgi:hypothetical protein